MPSRSDLEIKSRLVLGIGLLSLVVVLLLRLLLPLLAMIGLGALGFWLWRSHRKKQQQQQRQQARINAKFYQLLQQQQGRISVLDFAMRTQLDGAAAQAYLNTQAQAFSAFFETTPQGDLIYVFSSAAVGNAHQAQSDAVWTYAEQAKAEQAHAEKAHAAWSNAQQIRTLRHLSQNARPQDTSQSCPQLDVGGTSSENRSSLRNDAHSKNAISVNLKASSGFKLTKDDSANRESVKKPVIKLPKESGYPDPKATAARTAPISPAASVGSDQTPIVRGRAYSADDRVVTIDVTATRS